LENATNSLESSIGNVVQPVLLFHLGNAGKKLTNVAD